MKENKRILRKRGWPVTCLRIWSKECMTLGPENPPSVPSGGADGADTTHQHGQQCFL